jgi:hypothetical protein
MTRDELVAHIATVFAQRINPNATRGNSMDTEYAELAVEAIRDFGAVVLLPAAAHDIYQGRVHGQPWQQIHELRPDLSPETAVYVELESEQ